MSLGGKINKACACAAESGKDLLGIIKRRCSRMLIIKKYILGV